MSVKVDITMNSMSCYRLWLGEIKSMSRSREYLLGNKVNVMLSGVTPCNSKGALIYAFMSSVYVILVSWDSLSKGWVLRRVKGLLGSSIFPLACDALSSQGTQGSRYIFQPLKVNSYVLFRPWYITSRSYTHRRLKRILAIFMAVMSHQTCP